MRLAPAEEIAGDGPVALSIKLYLDVHVHRAITEALREGADVLTAQEDQAAHFSDSHLLDRATALDRVLFSQDSDLLREAARRQQTGESFGGVIYAHPLRITIGQCVRDLKLIAEAAEPEDFVNRVEYLPLK